MCDSWAFMFCRIPAECPPGLDRCADDGLHGGDGERGEGGGMPAAVLHHVPRRRHALRHRGRHHQLDE